LYSSTPVQEGTQHAHHLGNFLVNLPLKQIEEDWGDQTTLRYPSPHVARRRRGRQEGRLEYPIQKVG
jgi:hypothetical protein